MIKSVEKVLNYRGKNSPYVVGKDSSVRNIVGDTAIRECMYESGDNWCVYVECYDLNNKNIKVFALAGKGNKAVEDRLEIYREIAKRKGLTEMNIYEIPRVWKPKYITLPPRY